MKKDNLRKVMRFSWQFVNLNGFSRAEALKTAWANVELTERMRGGIVKFYFRKVDGTTREAYGTLCDKLLPPTGGGGRKPNDTVQVYYDTERREYRCYKKANLLAIA